MAAAGGLEPAKLRAIEEVSRVRPRDENATRWRRSGSRAPGPSPSHGKPNARRIPTMKMPQRTSFSQKDTHPWVCADLKTGPSTTGNRAREDQDPQPPDPRPALLRIRVLDVTARPRGKLGEGGEGRSERNVDPCLGVDGPTIGVQDRPQVSLTELQPGQDHGRAGDEEDDGRHPHRHQRAQGEERTHDGADSFPPTPAAPTPRAAISPVSILALPRASQARGRLRLGDGALQLFLGGDVRGRGPLGHLLLYESGDPLVGDQKA